MRDAVPALPKRPSQRAAAQHGPGAAGDEDAVLQCTELGQAPSSRRGSRLCPAANTRPNETEEKGCERDGLPVETDRAALPVTSAVLSLHEPSAATAPSSTSWR